MRLMTNKNKSPFSTGFSLVEVLVAILILGIALLGMAGLTVGIMKHNKFSRDTTVATTLAQEKMEDIQREGYPGISHTDAVITQNYGDIPGFPLFRRVTFVDANAPVAGFKKVTVMVFWDNNRHFLDLATLVVE